MNLILVWGCQNAIDAGKENNCHGLLINLILSTEEFQHSLADYQVGTLNSSKLSYIIEGVPDRGQDQTDLNLSDTYDITISYWLSYDEAVTLGTYSYDPDDEKLYLSELQGDAQKGKLNVKTISAIEYSETSSTPFMRCINENK